MNKQKPFISTSDQEGNGTICYQHALVGSKEWNTINDGAAAAGGHKAYRDALYAARGTSVYRTGEQIVISVSIKLTGRHGGLLRNPEEIMAMIHRTLQKYPGINVEVNRYHLDQMSIQEQLDMLARTDIYITSK